MEVAKVRTGHSSRKSAKGLRLSILPRWFALRGIWSETSARAADYFRMPGSNERSVTKMQGRSDCFAVLKKYVTLKRTRTGIEVAKPQRWRMPSLNKGIDHFEYAAAYLIPPPC
jgi:hypothetical protein